MAKILQPNAKTIQQLAEQWHVGELVAFGTETVYGLGADATNSEAVAKIYATKQRPAFNPLISHYASVDQIRLDVMWNTHAQTLAEAFWPGPLTLILPKSRDCRVCDLATAGLDTLAVRIPSHPVANALLKAVDLPIVAPSANPSGRLSPVTAQHVDHMLGDRISWILDGGPAQEGVESTVVDLSGERPTLLRFGTISLESLKSFLPEIAEISKTENQDTPKSPGMLLKHYAPSKPVLPLSEGVSPLPGDALLHFGSKQPMLEIEKTENLSPSENLSEAASQLFSLLHHMDQDQTIKRILFSAVPNQGIGRAINDRLNRAVEK